MTKLEELKADYEAAVSNVYAAFAAANAAREHVDITWTAYRDELEKNGEQR